MATIEITYWRDIPVLVTARTGLDEVTVPLSARFQDLVDRVALAAGFADADAYLAEWRTAPAGERSGPVPAAARAAADELEADFPALRARVLGGAPDDG
jgi:hypothetical protein